MLLTQPTPAPLRLYHTGQIQIFWFLTTAKRVVSSKPDCRLQSISSHKATNDVTDAMAMSLYMRVLLVFVIHRDRSVCVSVCVCLSLIIMASSVSLTQHCAESPEHSMSHSS